MRIGRRKPPEPATPPGDTETGETEDGPANAFEAAWPFNSDSPQVTGLLREDRFLSILLVDVTGLDWTAISGHLDSVRDIAATKRMVPVLVVDLLDFRGLVEEGLAYDTLPNVAGNRPFAEDLDWAAYLAARRRLLRDKWRPAAIINLGLNADWGAL